MWQRAAVAAVAVLCCVVAWGVRADRLTVSGCSQAWSLVYSPCAGGSGPPGGEHISSDNPGTLTASASYTQTGTYTNGPPAAIDYSFDGVGCGSAASSPTISGGIISFTNTAPSGSGSHTITLCDHADHSIFGTSTAFTVNGAVETIAATSPGALAASVSYTQAGTYTNGPPAAIDYSFDGVGCANAAGSPTISGGAISFTNTSPSAAGSHTITLCDGANHAIFGTSASFSVYTGPCDIATANGVAFTDWAGLRACSAAKLGTKLVNACHSTAGVDDGCADLNSDPVTGFLVPGVVDGTHTCPGAGCNVKTVYNQGSRAGTASGYAQNTVALRPTLPANCVNTSFPCLQGTGTVGEVSTAGSSTTSGVASLTIVTGRVACGATAAWRQIAQGGTAANRIQFLGSASTCAPQLAGSSGTISSSVTGVGAGVLHSMVGVINGVSSVINVDGTEGTGTVTGSAVTATSIALSPNAATADLTNTTEFGWTDAKAFSSGVRQSLCLNQTAAWGLSSAGCGGSSCPNALDFTQSCDSMYIAVVMP